MLKHRFFLKFLLILLTALGTISVSRVSNLYGSSKTQQNDLYIYEEAQTVYLGNLARQAHGVPPLRWNNQLTQAARWFAWDSVENRPDPYCGHEDTQGNGPAYRAKTFGYLGGAGAENAFCGYVTPSQAIQGWLDSPPHRDNLLGAGHREIGLGYYRRESDGRGYVAQMFGADAVYPPVIINHEALTTTLTTVELHIYDRTSGGGFKELGPATEMRIGNNPCFAETSWEPYTTTKQWALESGTGWRDVYVQTRDVMSRTATVSDTIYLGQNLPLSELALQQASTTRSEVELVDLNKGDWPTMQFSLNWAVDDTYDTFALNWGNGERVSDPEAIGGTAFRLQPGAGESNAWVWTTEFVKDTPFVAYVRLKTSNNTITNEVARFAINGGGVEYGTLSLKGTDFAASNQYQEFALPFTFHDDPNNSFLIMNFWRSNSADIYVDAVHIFTQPISVTSPFIWDVPGGNYRGQGIWVRFVDEIGGFSPIEQARLGSETQELSIQPNRLTFIAEKESGFTNNQILMVTPSVCSSTPSWTVASDASWLVVEKVSHSVVVQVDTTTLAVGEHQATVKFTLDDKDYSIPVSVVIVDAFLSRLFLPLIER